MEGINTVVINDENINLDKLYSVKEIAKYLGVDPRTVYDEIRDGNMKCTHIKGAIKIPYRYLYDYVFKADTEA